MGDRVLSPAVVRLEVQCVSPRFLGDRITAALFKPEGVHSEQERVTWVIAGPSRKCPGDPPIEIIAVTMVEIREVADLEGKQVARVFNQQLVQGTARAVPVAGRPLLQRVRVPPLAIVDAISKIFEIRDAFLDLRNAALLPHARKNMATQDVSHRKVRVCLQGFIDDGHRVAPIGIESPQRSLIDFQAL